MLNVDSDEKDGLVDGDGKGTLQMGSAIWDQPQTSYLKIVKKDKTTGETVAKPGAKYVIHDVEGAYFNWYMEDKTSEEKVDYINRFGNLVVAYTNGEMLGSYENPYVTAERKDSDGRVLGTYVSTTTTLPQGLYILEEVQAPEGYKLLVLKFEVENKTNEEQAVDLYNKDVNYNIVVDNSRTTKQMLTILADDLYTYDKTIQASSREEAVLLYTVSDSVANKWTDLKLQIKYGGTSAVLQLEQ